MARPKDHTPVTFEDLVAQLERLREQVVDLARRLSGGDNTAYKTLKVQKHQLRELEQEVRFHHKKQRRLAWEM